MAAVLGVHLFSGLHKNPTSQSVSVAHAVLQLPLESQAYGKHGFGVLTTQLPLPSQLLSVCWPPSQIAPHEVVAPG
jgi:hypothetical protein